MCGLGADEQTNHFNGFNKSFAIVPSGDSSSSSDLKIRRSQLPSILCCQTKIGVWDQGYLSMWLKLLFHKNFLACTNAPYPGADAALQPQRSVPSRSGWSSARVRMFWITYCPRRLRLQTQSGALRLSVGRQPSSFNASYGPAVLPRLCSIFFLE
jgi:hypothetical protein